MNVKAEQRIEVTLTLDEAHDIFHDLGCVRARSESLEKIMEEFEPKLANQDLCTNRKYA